MRPYLWHGLEAESLGRVALLAAMVAQVLIQMLHLCIPDRRTGGDMSSEYFDAFTHNRVSVTSGLKCSADTSLNYDSPPIKPCTAYLSRHSDKVIGPSDATQLLTDCHQPRSALKRPSH